MFFFLGGGGGMNLHVRPRVKMQEVCIVITLLVFFHFFPQIVPSEEHGAVT